jgi:hypothetical protein
MAIPEVNPVNNFGGNAVFEGNALVVATSTSLVGSDRLSVEGSQVISFNITGAAGLIKVELPDPTLCAGQFRKIVNAGGAAQNVQLVAYDASGAGLGANVGAACQPFVEAAASPYVKICGNTVYSTGSAWIVTDRLLGG